MTIEVVSQKNCHFDDAKYTVVEKLLVTFLNQSKNNLVVDKDIGAGFYGIHVVRDAKDLSGGKYEYDPQIEWGMTPPPGELLNASPVLPFVVLAPNESIQFHPDFWVEVRLHESDAMRSDWPIRPGDHVMELVMGAWSYSTKPEEVQKRWQSYGDLVHKPIKTEPFAFRLPTDPKIEKCN